MSLARAAVAAKPAILANLANLAKRALLPSLAGLCALASSAGCVVNLRYPPEPSTPAAAFRMPYVLAVADFVDRRTRIKGLDSLVDGRPHRHLEDWTLAHLAMDLSVALGKRLSARGLFRAVRDETPEGRAHLLLTGELLAFRVEADREALRAAEKVADAPPKEGPAPPLPLVPLRVDASLRLRFWRVDLREVVVELDVKLSERPRARGLLYALSGEGLRVVVHALARRIEDAMGPYAKTRGYRETGLGATMVNVKEPGGRARRVLSRWVEDQPKWPDVTAVSPKRSATFPPADEPPPELGERPR